MDSNDIKIRYWSLFLVLGIISFAVFLSISWEFTADDAFGIFRYSKNIAAGHGFVWNVGSEPVEGSSFLQYVLLVGFDYSGIDMILMSKIIGMLSLLGIIVLFGLISRYVLKEFPKRFILLGFFIGITLLLSNPATSIHMVSGMDTMLLSALLLLTIFMALKSIDNASVGNLVLFSLSCLLLAMLRPEGIAVSIILMLLIFVTRRKDKGFSRFRSIKAFSVFFILPVVVYTIWKTLYFGGLFNLAFVTKTLTHGGLLRGFPTFMRVMGYLSPFLITIALISLFFLGSNIFSGDKKKKLDRHFIFIQAAILGAISFVPAYIFSVMMMNFAQRYYYPVFVLVYIIVGISIAILYHHLVKSKHSISYAKQIKAFGIAVSVLFLIGANVYFISHLQDTIGYTDGVLRGHVPLGKAMNKYKDNNLTMAAIDMGALSYYSEWTFYELGGLMDKHIAEQGYASYEYVEILDPDLIILISNREDVYDKDIIPLLSYMQDEVYRYAETNGFIQSDGVKVKDGYYLISFIKPDLEDLPDMLQSIEVVSERSLNS